MTVVPISGNGLIQQTQFNNEILINNLIDSYDRLAWEYKMEKEMRRQKIISKLNSNAKEYTLLYKRNKNKEEWIERKSKRISTKVDLVIFWKFIFIVKTSW